MPNFKLKNEDSENIKTDCVDTVVYSLHQIKQMNFFGTPGTIFNWKKKRSIFRDFGRPGRKCHQDYMILYFFRILHRILAGSLIKGG